MTFATHVPPGRKRGSGRKPIGAESMGCHVAAALDDRTHRRLVAIAARRGVPVGRLVREVLLAALPGLEAPQ